jgi:hypothetical protein
MIALLIVFYLFVAVFSFIGGMRGWAKEILVTFSVILALAFIAVIENLIPFLRDLITRDPVIQYWVRTIIVLVMTFFGYQSPKLTRLTKATERRERIQDLLLGLILGAVSGYFVVGTLWSFASQAGYPLLNEYIQPPATAELAQATERVLRYMPPVWLDQPMIYIAVVFAFIFVIVVFI